MSDTNESLPTLREAIESYLGIQLPTVPLPQTLKNTDKAIAKIILAAGEHIEAKIRGATKKTKAQIKEELESDLRTPDEKRKFQNRFATTEAALADLKETTGSADANSEIEDDWLNLFSRIAEDKTSEELRTLFGKILAGEIRRPGSFSLRTLQLIGTLSKADAEAVAEFLSYALDRMVVAFRKDKKLLPTPSSRLLMQELGIALGNPNQLGGMQLEVTVQPNSRNLTTASKAGILVDNNTNHTVEFSIAAQPLSNAAKELSLLATLAKTEFSYLEELAQTIASQCQKRYQDDWQTEKLLVHIVDLGDLRPDGLVSFNVCKTIRYEKPPTV